MTETYTLVGGFPTIPKDPSAILDYSINLSSWLALVPGDAIATVVWTTSAGITKTAQSNTSTTATAWFSGGVLGTTESAKCQFTTAQGRTDERTINFLMINR
jgi:hypothetical protein